jgi:purine-binding chemotaxis protein CheW
MSTQAEAGPGQYLTFTLKNQTYGVPIATVREINRVSEITQVPQTPAFVAGVMNLRGKVIPVVDLRLKLSMERAEHTKATCVIVIEGESGQIGMIVDSVNGVIELAASQIEPPPMVGVSAQDSSVMGMGKVDDQVILLLAIVQCLSKENLTGLIESSAASAA